MSGVAVIAIALVNFVVGMMVGAWVYAMGKKDGFQAGHTIGELNGWADGSTYAVSKMSEWKKRQEDYRDGLRIVPKQDGE